MNAADFDLKVSLPAAPQYAETLRGLAAHAARYAGSGEREAERYGKAVQSVALACLNGIDSGELPVVLRRTADAVECLITCGRRFDGPAAGERRITIGWTSERGNTVCRVALEL